jgi:hypothetical protein
MHHCCWNQLGRCRDGNGVPLARRQKKSSSGQITVTGVSATINHPHALAVDLIHGSGDVVWGCSKGFSVSSWTKQYGAGLHQLAHIAGQNSCNVTASVEGAGHVTVEILTAG